MSVTRRDLARMRPETEAFSFDRARIEVLDWETKRCVKEFEYQPQSDNLGEGMGARFTGGCSWRGKWLQTSNTELVIYDTANWTIEKVISSSGLTR